MNDQRAFTVVEVVVAVLVLSVGLLGLMSTASVVSRVIAEARFHGRLGALAMQQIERVHMRGCDLAAGVEVADGGAVTRSVRDMGDGVRVVLLSLTSRSRRGLRVDTVATSVGC